ncbi:MAG: DoxX family protein [Gemmatimonadota bacterium]
MSAATTYSAKVVRAAHARPLARHIQTVSRVLMGFLFTMVGLNGFLNFLPQPSSIPAGAMAFSGALLNTGYMFPLLMGAQLIAGVLLFANRFVPLALAILAPVVINIVAFHAFLSPSGLGMALVVLVLEVYLAWSFRAAFRPMLSMKVGR